MSRAVILAIGCDPSWGNMCVSSIHTHFLSVMGASLPACMAIHSRATRSKVVPRAAFAARRSALGSVPAAISFLAASRLPRASFSERGGYTPSESSFSRPLKRYFSRHQRAPVGMSSRNRPPASASLRGRSVGFVLRAANSVSGGIGGGEQGLRIGELPLYLPPPVVGCQRMIANEGGWKRPGL